MAPIACHWHFMRDSLTFPTITSLFIHICSHSSVRYNYRCKSSECSFTSFSLLQFYLSVFASGTQLKSLFQILYRNSTISFFFLFFIWLLLALPVHFLGTFLFFFFQILISFIYQQTLESPIAGSNHDSIELIKVSCWEIELN